MNPSGSKGRTKASSSNLGPAEGLEDLLEDLIGRNAFPAPQLLEPLR